jgi:hypothetical protein
MTSFTVSTGSRASAGSSALNYLKAEFAISKKNYEVQGHFLSF